MCWYASIGMEYIVPWTVHFYFLPNNEHIKGKSSRLDLYTRIKRIVNNDKGIIQKSTNGYIA